MKVRHKLSGEIWEVVDEKNDFLFGYREQDGKYVNVDAYQLAAMRKSEYEPIPTEPRWQDVTGECEVKQVGDAVYLEDDDACVAKIMQLNDYRLRKVSVFTGFGDRDSAIQAFLVERKVSE